MGKSIQKGSRYDLGGRPNFFLKKEEKFYKKK